jgi:uncharacterized protein YcsI (UPF0317 family)
MVVSMRWYRPEMLTEVRDITKRLTKQQGGPVAWGWKGAEYLGLTDKTKRKQVDFGEWSEPENG